jgi:hypothetical protein
MSKSLKIFLGIFVLIVILIGYFYYSLTHIGFMGNRDPEAVEASNKRLNGILLSAEYRKGTDYCEINLLDSINIEIIIGDSYGGSILNKEYAINKDTIKIIGGVTEIDKYNFSDRLVVLNDKIFYKIESNKKLDTAVSMKIRTMKIKL